MRKSILQSPKKVTIAIYSPDGDKVSQVSFFACRCDVGEIVALFERMDGSYIGAMRSLLCGLLVWLSKRQLYRLARYCTAVRELYGRNNIARAFVGDAPRKLNLKLYRFRLARTEWVVKAPSPEAAYMLYKSFHSADVCVFDYLRSKETTRGGVFIKTKKRDPHNIGYMRVIPAGREGRN